MTRFPVLRARCLALAVRRTAACRQAADPNLIRLNGRIEAVMVDLSPKVTGRVREVLVREGERVKAGDVLVRLDLGEDAPRRRPRPVAGRRRRKRACATSRPAAAPRRSPPPRPTSAIARQR